MKGIESFESKKENLSEWQREILEGIGFANIESLASWIKLLDPESEGAEYLRMVLEAVIAESPKEPEITEKEAEELLEAMRKREAESESPETRIISGTEKEEEK